MSLNIQQLEAILTHLRTQPSENEVFEFKEAKKDYDFSKLGKYFSALANEANLKGQSFAWLIFGIRDSDRTIVGSQYRSDRSKLDSLKGEIANKTANRITFIEIYELPYPEGRIIMFQIPSAPKGIPVSFEGHYYGRDGEELSPLNIEEIERIRGQLIMQDWSAAIIPDATLSDLDPAAIAKARQNYKEKYPNKAVETDGWDDITFLNKAKITVKGKITRTTILLLGREESEHFINPAEAKIRWVLKDRQNIEKDYEIFSCPFLLAVNKIYAKIRNLKYRYMKEGTLFPDEILKFEPFVIREAINNCIAHQDYAMGGRINVIEIEDEQLIFTNCGSFIPGSVEKVVFEDSPEEYYRNKFLVAAMFNLKMVDTAGGGIKKMYNFQRQRFFPLPEYDLSDNKVKVTVVGKVLDVEFARALAKNPDLTLEQIIALDKVQKKKCISDDEINFLRNRGLIEGRKPNIFISAKVAAESSNNTLKAQYIKHRGFDDNHYKKLIVEYIRKYGSASRNDIEVLLRNKLPDILDETQKQNKIGNLLKALKMGRVIENAGSKKKPEWGLI